MTWEFILENSDHQRQHEIQNLKSKTRLIASDIDGTLLDSYGEVPQANRRALQQAYAQRVKLALVTARKRSSAFAIGETLGVPYV